MPDGQAGDSRSIGAIRQEWGNAVVMKIAAITMVHEEYAMLEKWYHHYGNLVGYDNLYVMSHGRDDRHRDITPKASHVTVPRDKLSGFEGRRQKSLADFQKSLFPYYDAVIRVDVDELVFVDPDLHDSLHDCFEATQLDKTDAWFALGFNLFSMDPGLSVDLNSTISETMRDCFITSVYSKAIASRWHSVVFLHGALYTGPKKLHQDRYKMPKGLYLAHLKYVNADELAAANRVRADMTSKDIHGDKRAEIGAFWEDGDEEARKWLERWRSYPELEAETTFEEARQKMTTPWRLVAPKTFLGDEGRVLVQKYNEKARVRLPDRFVGLF